MSQRYFVDLSPVGVRKEVNAFNAIALKLPVLSDYVVSRRGKPVTSVMFEEGVFIVFGILVATGGAAR